ncbi:type II toxin-antitoxin system VapC family toxin [Metallibacterium sp.]|jgi:predicted nucleic acid-binding protein|uniref:type II toxin-antitoxin system VapC family toxin n=1 Tax=Metallibacterium sp. TaxID=2940281 RepID=UPI00260A8420|nr:type II toxin-antitoxin system VapC family toxin [Metallibacterium sp.]
MPFVIDNSVVCGWFLANQSTDYTEAIARRLLDDGAIAPGLWPLELANVLRTACKRGAMIASQAREVAEQIAALPIAVDAQPPTTQAILALALRYDLSSYDAAYLELALRLQLPIATQDTALAEAAMAAGVGMVR